MRRLFEGGAYSSKYGIGLGVGESLKQPHDSRREN